MANTTNNLDNINEMQIFRLRDLIKPSFDLWLFSWLLGLVTVIAVVGLLMLSGWFLTATALAGMVALGSHSFNYMMPAAIIRMFAIARTAGRYGELMVSHHAIFNLLKSLRLRFFRVLSAKPLTAQHQSLQSSQLMHRLVSDIDTLDEFNLRFISPWLLSGLMVLTLLGFIAVVLPLSVIWVVVLSGVLWCSLLIPLLMSSSGVFRAKILAQLSESRRNSLLAPLSIITQLLIWKQWSLQTQAFIEHDDALQHQHWQAQKLRSLGMMLMQWVLMLAIVLVLVATVQFGNIESNIVNTSLATGNLAISVPIVMAVVLGLFGLQEVILPLGQHYLSLGNSLTAKKRLNELLNINTTSLMAQANNLLSLPDDGSELTVALTELSCKLPNAIVGAENINVTIKSGVPLMVTGASGCGKSTLLQTLANELEPQSGQILLNGQAWQAYDWKDQLGYLGQQLDIFDQTLADNLRLGKPDASDEELMAVLNKVALGEWVQTQPQGLNTHLGEYGTGISGGQARRIALARLLLKPRKVLLLDEPFAGLDAHTQEQIWQTITHHQQEGVLVIVSHHHTKNRPWIESENVDWLAL